MRKLVAFHLLSYRCIVTINVLWLFLTVPWVGLQYVIVVFPDHTHLLFGVFLSGPLRQVLLYMQSILSSLVIYPIQIDAI